MGENPIRLTDIIESFTRVLGEEASAATKIACISGLIAGAVGGFYFAHEYVNELRHFNKLPEWAKYAIDAGIGMCTALFVSQLAKLPEEIYLIYKEELPKK